jgi:N-acetylglucosaminyldiphosphoundecaprenol N-acetyl-beta-D-mannosaminyltransferase
VALRTQRLFGCDFVSEASIDEVAAAVHEGTRDEGAGWRCVVTPNVDHLVRYDRHPDEAAVAADAWINLPDGMPIVWASRLLRRPLRERLAGSDLFAALWPRLAGDGVPTVVIASSDAVAGGLAAEHPAVRTVVPPIFDATDPTEVEAVVDDVLAAVEATDARVVVVGVTMVKHHLLARRLRARWEGRPSPPIVLLLGASADLYLGFEERAPGWMQRWGLEWLHRLLRDPRRMARRYLVDDPWFAVLLMRELRGRGAPSAAS